jgi:uncharacterized protein (DUF983 family)
MEIRCINCSERNVFVDIETANMRCYECDHEFTVHDVKALIDAWNLVIPWLLAHPSKPAPVPPI